MHRTSTTVMGFAKSLAHLLPWRYEKLPEKEKDDRETECRAEQPLSSLEVPLEKWPVALLMVKGMTCAACSKSVETALRAVAGVKRATIALLQESAEVHFDDGVVTAEQLVAAVEDAGFDGGIISVRHPKQQLEALRVRITGMVCAACSTAVENALLSHSGVTKVGVSLAQGEAEVTFDAAIVSAEKLVAAVEDAGFDAQLLSQGGLETLTLKVTGMTCGNCSTSIEASLRRVDGVAKAVVNLVSGQAEVLYNPATCGPRNLIRAVEKAGGDFSAELLTSSSQQGGAAAANARELRYWWGLLSSSLLFTIPVFFVAMVLPMLPGGKAIQDTKIFGFPCNQLVKWILTTPVQFIIGWRFHRGAFKALRRGTANMDVLVSLGTNASYIYSLISIIHHHINRHHMSGDYVPTDFFETSAMLISLILLGKYLEASAKGRTGAALAALAALAPDTATLVKLDESGAVVATEEVQAMLVHKGDVLKVLPGGKIPTDGVISEGQSYLNEAMVTGEAAPRWKTPGDVVIGGTINTSNPLLITATRVGTETVLSQIVRLVEHAQMSKAPVQAFADRVAAVFVPIIICLSIITWVGWYAAGMTGAFPASWLPEGHTPFLFALLFGIAVLVIACPCALGLATPTAVMVGTGVAAQLGILIKGADALEAASKVDVVVFDKTGTLTHGRPSVVDCGLFDETGVVDRQMLCRCVGAAESGSEHPLARAALDYCRLQLVMAEHGASTAATQHSGWQGQLPMQHHQRASSSGVPPDAPSLEALLPKAHEVQVAPGVGISCHVSAEQLMRPTVNGQAHQSSGAAGGSGGGGNAKPLHTPPPLPGCRNGTVRVSIGNRLMMQQESVRIPDMVEDYILPLETTGHTCIMVALNGRLVAVMAIADPLKPEAPGVVAALRARGVQCIMLTGDNWRTGRAVAAQVGVDAVFAEMLPKTKAQKIKDLQAGGRIVAMVGDGINDSPALAAADVGVAVGSGTDVAIEAADYVLMRDDLEDVLTAIDVSKKTFNRIRLNYVWAMGYNLLMVPVAAGVFYPLTHIQIPPWVAGMCMAFSSLSVVLSSLALRGYRRPASVLREVTVHGGDAGGGARSHRQQQQDGERVPLRTAYSLSEDGGRIPLSSSP